MQTIDLDGIYNSFNDMCFDKCQYEYYRNEDDFIDDVLSDTFKYLLIPVYGDDEETINRRAREYLTGFVYRDPVTGWAKTFVEWSKFFNDEYELRDSLDELYNRCDDMSHEIAELKSIIKEQNATLERIKNCLQ